MTIPESRVDPGALVISVGESSHVTSPTAGVVTIGRDQQATVQIDDPLIASVHLRAEFTGDGWRIVDTSTNGIYLGGSRTATLPVTQGLELRLGDPAEGPSVRFGVLDGETAAAVDPGMARAGAAAAARRRELDISQRSLAADGIINAGALISFEKGRSWPRDRTRTKLEEVLRWPSGTIAAIRAGGAGRVGNGDRTEVEGRAGAGDEGSLIAQAVVAAVNTLGSTIDALPPPDAGDFTPRVSAILSDLRQLEAVAARATRIGRVTPALIKALSTVRRRVEELTMLAATGPDATLGQRLYAARRKANLTIAETAQAAGIGEEAIVGAEAGEPIVVATANAIESLMEQLDWG